MALSVAFNCITTNGYDSMLQLQLQPQTEERIKRIRATRLAVLLILI